MKYADNERKIMQIVEMKTKLEEKIRALEDEKRRLLEEREQLREIVQLSEKSQGLEKEIYSLKSEVKSLRGKIPREFLQEIEEVASAILEENVGEAQIEECSNCEEEELL
jgi:predicted  nucleic acid-binding Zn-ribbon protein